MNRSNPYLTPPHSDDEDYDVEEYEDDVREELDPWDKVLEFLVLKLNEVSKIYTSLLGRYIFNEPGHSHSEISHNIMLRLVDIVYEIHSSAIHLDELNKTTPPDPDVLESHKAWLSELLRQLHGINDTINADKNFYVRGAGAKREYENFKIGIRELDNFIEDAFA